MNLPAWINLLTILGGLMVLISATFLTYRVANQRRTYRALRPKQSAQENDPSATVVFIWLAFFGLAIGLLLFGLGLASALRPDQVLHDLLQLT